MEDRKLTVRAVERALDILMCFTKDSELALTEISTLIGLHKSTVHRSLTTLEDKGFVVRNKETEKYRLGLKIWELSMHLSQSDDPAIRLLPAMEALRDRLGETVSLYLRDGSIVFDSSGSEQPGHSAGRPGRSATSVVGWRFQQGTGGLAPPADQEEPLNAPDWPESVDRIVYRRYSAEILEKGYAISIEEREPEPPRVSVPIFDRNGQVAATLSMSGPVTRLSAETLREHAPILMEAAREMGMMI